MKKRIYFTHCTSKKDDSLKDTGIEVSPDELYVGKKIQGFIKQCKSKNVEWAIFSDKYGIWFPQVKHVWYEKSPNEVTDNEFRELVAESYERLKPFDEIYFYANYRSPRFHHLYKELHEKLLDNGLNIQLISRKEDIE